MQARRSEIRILHCGDLHLDSPFDELSPKKSEERRRELRECFCDMMQYVKDESIDLVLISGDLYDSRYVTADTVDLLMREFRSAQETHFVIAPGNRDPRSPKSIYAAGRFGNNVHVFEDEVLTRIDFDHLGTAVYGWAFTGAEHRFSPLAKKKASPGFLNLLCGHCALDRTESVHCPVTSRDLELFGADYAGFSHFHVGGGFRTVGRTVCAYSGCLENRSYEEPGIGGVNLIIATAAEQGWQIFARRLTLGRYRYGWEKLDVTGVGDPGEMEERIRALARRVGVDEKMLLRVDLVGEVPPGTRLPLAEDSSEFGAYALQIRDRTLPTYGDERLLKDMTARGQLYRTLLPRLTEGSPEERATAAAALRVGLAALEDRDVTIF